MGWTPLPTASRCARLAVLLTPNEEGGVHGTGSHIGIDLAKNSFQLHGARADGSVAFRKKLSRSKLLDFVAAQPRCTVAMEACGGAHHWGREIGSLGHAVRLVPPIYVKAYVKRQKNDASDAEAICEASSRPTMRFVAVKTEEQQARGMLFRTRDLLVRQRTQKINALRGHLAEFGVIAPQGPAHVGRLASALEGPASRLPEAVRELAGLLLEQIAGLDAKIAGLEREVHVRARQDEEARRLMSVPGIGPITATVIAVEIVRKSPDQVGFAVQPRRWVVERFFAWINRNRRLAKDFEATIASARAFLYAASVMLLVRRLARAA